MRLVVVASGVAALCLGAQAFAQQKPNVVVFLADDMGYADTGPFGAKDIRTPHIDRLAREGVRLTNSYSNGPVCTPTRAGLMTGRYQQRAGLEWALLPTDKGKGLPESEITIARILKGAGYATAIFGKWHLGGESEFNPRVHGFDKFFGITGGNADMYSHENRFGTHDLWEDTEKVGKTGYLTEILGDRAAEWISAHSREPFFLYVPFNAVHWPFQAADRPDDVRNLQTWYDGTRPKDYAPMLEAMDAAIGRVLAALDKHGLAQNTLVIFTNDNGGERLSDNTPLFHQKATLWEGGIRVPSIVRFPGRLPAGKVSNQVTMTMDFAASILAATGAGTPAGRKLDGINLLPVLGGKQAPVERTLFWRIDRADRNQKAVRQGNWKYVRDGAIEMLFDLERDVSERTNISFRHPEKLAALRNAMQEWEAELERTPPKFVVK